MKINKYFVVLILIIAFGSFLRIYGLNISPPSLNWDETSLGYNAYSISKTTRDEYGAFFPIFTRSFDDYKSAIPAYLIIPTLYIFGVNEIGVRIMSSLFGIISILLIYLIARKLFNLYVGIISAFLFAISPFAVFFSRGLFEANIGLTFFLTGFLLFLYRKKKIFIYASLLFFILAMYTYHSYRLLVPLFLIGLFFLYKLEFWGSRKIIKLIILGGIILIPMILFTFDGQTTARIGSTSILKLWPPPLVTQFQNSLHNPFYYFSWEVGGRYLSYFSPLNLFYRESLEPGLVVPTLAPLFPFTFIFWLIGLLSVFKFNKNKELLLLILIAPIPAVITWNWFHPNRVLPLFAMFTIVASLGIYESFNFLKQRLGNIFARGLLVSLILFGIWSAFYLFDSLLIILPREHLGDWQPGFRESMAIIVPLEKDYDQIIVDTAQAQPYIFTLFYAAYPPQKYLEEVDMAKNFQKPRKYYDFGKYKFRRIDWRSDRGLHKTVFMGSIYSLPELDIKDTPGAKIVKDVLDKNGDPQVRIVTLD